MSVPVVMEPGFGQADLTNCDREPIHIPGAVQPHGVLLGVSEPDLVVRVASRNTRELLGREHGEVLGMELGALLDGAALATIEGQRKHRSFRRINPLSVTAGGRAFDAIVHRTGSLLVVELEPAVGGAGTYRDFSEDTRQFMARLESAEGVLELLQGATEEVRRITGFDRVMVYRFAPDGHGEVATESRRDDLEPFLGLHYPASDIPAQARRLYALNRLRLIADVGYRAVELAPDRDPQSGAPLDLSHAVLRSVSPIHLEYLANMGVAASMSISLLRDEKLWGLIACHHYSRPRLVPYQARMTCELLGQTLSWMLTEKLRAVDAEVRVRANDVRTRLGERLAVGTDVGELVHGTPGLLDAVSAGGVAVIHEGHVSTAGRVPPRPKLRALADWLREHATDELFVSDRLSAEYSAAAELADIGSGLLAIGFPRSKGSFLLWFRPEAARTVRWAGKPDKVYDEGPHGARLTPRGSFAEWLETVHQRSLPWEAWELAAARELRTLLVEVALRKADELERTRDMLLGILGHDLRNPLGAIAVSADILRQGEVLPEAAIRVSARIASSTDRMRRMIEQLLDYTRVRSGGGLGVYRVAVDLALLCRQLAEESEAARPNRKILVDVPDHCIAECDPDRMAQVLSNLLGNARHHSADEGTVRLTLECDDATVTLSVHNFGPPVPPDLLPRIFDAFRHGEEVGASRRSGGLGLGLYIARQIVVAHGGTIAVTSDATAGTTFTVKIPRKPSTS